MCRGKWHHREINLDDDLEFGCDDMHCTIEAYWWPWKVGSTLSFRGGNINSEITLWMGTSFLYYGPSKLLGKEILAPR